MGNDYSAGEVASRSPRIESELFGHGRGTFTGAHAQKAGWRIIVLTTYSGAAQSPLGPGAWSVDARRFGWKRIEIRRPDR